MNKKGRYGYSFGDGEDLNPMNYISNLSDVMMLLAVGIMLALIMHWNVPIQTSQETVEQNQETVVEFTEDDLESTNELPENMEKTGEVFYDPDSGSYYIVYGTP